MTEEIQVKSYRKTLLQTSIILNVSKLTVRRMADRGELEWSDGQITMESIKKYLSKASGKHKKEEIEKEIKEKIQKHVTLKPRRQSSGWITSWK